MHVQRRQWQLPLSVPNRRSSRRQTRRRQHRVRRRSCRQSDLSFVPGLDRPHLRFQIWARACTDRAPALRLSLHFPSLEMPASTVIGLAVGLSVSGALLFAVSILALRFRRKRGTSDVDAKPQLDRRISQPRIDPVRSSPYFLPSLSISGPTLHMPERVPTIQRPPDIVIAARRPPPFPTLRSPKSLPTVNETTETPRVRTFTRRDPPSLEFASSASRTGSGSTRPSPSNSSQPADRRDSTNTFGPNDDCAFGLGAIVLTRRTT